MAFVLAAASGCGIAASDAPAIETKRLTSLYDEVFGDRKGDAMRGKQIVAQVCAQCHGTDGNAVEKNYPSLSAQLPNYLATQLVLYKMQKRRSPVMGPIAGGLFADEMLDIASYLAQQNPGKPYESANADLLANGEKLYKTGDVQRGIPACTWCHGPNGNAVGPIIPRIGGQSPVYLDFVLGVLKKFFFYGEEAYVMKAVLVNMTDTDISAVAEYTSTLKSSPLIGKQ